jgi:ketosteroid isomerase-like protein
MRVIHAVALGLALTACQPAQARFSTQDELDIRAAYRAFEAAAAAGNVEAIAGFYAAGWGSRPPNMQFHNSRTAALRELWTGRTAHANVQLTFHVTTVAGEVSLAYAVGGYHLVTTMKDTTQAAPPPEDGKFVSVLGRQTDGSWKIIADNWSTNAPAAVPTPAPLPAHRR